MATEEIIYYENIEGIIHLVLNSPPKNEMNFEFFEVLYRVVDDIKREKDIKGLLIYGNGRHFSSGADVNELHKLAQNYRHPESRKENPYFERNTTTFINIETLDCPKVAIIKGCCFGSGLELALTCDVRFATKNSVFSLPESTFGFIPGCGGTIRIQRFVNKDKALELIFTGRTMLSDEAKEIGLVDYISDKKTIIKDAIKLINTLSLEGK
jgi:enoyl-CoA hydratase/carnithine racemase